MEDVSGQVLSDYLREHVFQPLGMENTDLVRSERVSRACHRLRGALPRPRARGRPGGAHAWRRGSVLDLGRPGSIRAACCTRERVPVAGSCKRRPSRSCSPRSSSRTCAYPAWAWASTSGTRAAGAPLARTVWCRAFAALSMAPSAGIGVGPGQHRRAERPRGPRPRRDGLLRRLLEPPRTRSAPTSRRDRTSGPSCAAGTPPPPARSRTSSHEH